MLPTILHFLLLAIIAFVGIVVLYGIGLGITTLLWNYTAFHGKVERLRDNKQLGELLQLIIPHGELEIKKNIRPDDGGARVIQFSYIRDTAHGFIPEEVTQAAYGLYQLYRSIGLARKSSVPKEVIDQARREADNATRILTRVAQQLDQLYQVQSATQLVTQQVVRERKKLIKLAEATTLSQQVLASESLMVDYAAHPVGDLFPALRKAAEDLTKW